MRWLTLVLLGAITTGNSVCIGLQQQRTRVTTHEHQGDRPYLQTDTYEGGQLIKRELIFPEREISVVGWYDSQGRLEERGIMSTSAKRKIRSENRRFYRDEERKAFQETILTDTDYDGVFDSICINVYNHADILPENQLWRGEGRLDPDLPLDALRKELVGTINPLGVITSASITTLRQHPQISLVEDHRDYVYEGRLHLPKEPGARYDNDPEREYNIWTVLNLRTNLQEQK